MAVMARGGGIEQFFQAHLDALERELRGPRRGNRLRELVDGLMRVQALLAPDADSAAACLAGVTADPAGIAPLRRLAAELFACHRGRIDRIRAGELARAGFVAQRKADRGARGHAAERLAAAFAAAPGDEA